MNDIHSNVVELLPWFVNSTLSEQDRTLVEQHVSECLPCRRALRDEQALYELLSRSTAPTDRAAGLEKLLQATATARPRRALAAGFAAAASIVIALAGYWTYSVRDRPPDPPDFATLADTPPAAPQRIDVVFSETATDAEIRQFLTALGGTVVAGPSRIGRYTIDLPADADPAGVVDRIRNDPRVRFAGPAFAPEPVR